MTAKQRARLFGDWWPAACQAQGWDESDRTFRLEKFGEILGRELASAAALGNRDIDTLKRRLMLLTKPTLDTALADNAPEDGGERARRLNWLAHRSDAFVKPVCLAMFHAWPPRELQTWQLRSLMKRLVDMERAATEALRAREVGAHRDAPVKRAVESSPEPLNAEPLNTPF